MKVRLVMFGLCKRCGREHVRKPPIDLTVCMCENPNYMPVPLTLAVSLSNGEHAKFSKIAQLAGVTTEQLVNKLLTEGAKQKLRQMKRQKRRQGDSIPVITVTTTRGE